jgi:hypothetical protein
MTFGFANAWEQAVKDIADGGEDFDVPEEDFTVRVVKARTETTKDDVGLAKLRLRVLGGDHDGCGFDHTMSFGSEYGARMAIIALRGYGLDTDKVTSFDDLDRELATLVGVEADVTTSWSTKGFLNVTVSSARRPPTSQPDGTLLPSDQSAPNETDTPVPF